MKTKAKFLIFPCIISMLIFQSCAQKDFKSSLTCEELSNRLGKEIFVPQDEFNQYTTEEINFLFSSPESYDDISIIYSTDSTDVCEIGVIYSENKEDAKKLYEDAKLYIKNLQEQKSEFLRNYSPEELSKLNSAEARCFGNYIIFTVANQNDKQNIFNTAEKLLSQ